jgi:hypothetical protein
MLVCATYWEDAINQSQAAASEWELITKLDSFDVSDTTWDTPDNWVTQTESVEVQTYASLPHVAPILAQAYMLRVGGGVGFGSPVNMTTWEFPLKEGLIFDEDYKYLVPIKIIIPYDDAVADSPLHLFRLRVSAELQAFDGSAPFPTTGVSLQVIGYSVWQRAKL